MEGDDGQCMEVMTSQRPANQPSYPLLLSSLPSFSFPSLHHGVFIYVLVGRKGEGGPFKVPIAQGASHSQGASRGGEREGGREGGK